MQLKISSSPNLMTNAPSERFTGTGIAGLEFNKHPWAQRNIAAIASEQNHDLTHRIPEHIEMLFPEPSPDAPRGHLKIVPESESAEAYITERRRKLSQILQNKTTSGSKRKHERISTCKQLTSEEVDFLASQPKRMKTPEPLKFTLPREFPRDEFGVRIGNYLDGVSFLKHAIQQCGGAIPLERVEIRIGATSELKENIGNIRQFLDIHDAIFAVHDLNVDRVDEGPNLVITIRDELSHEISDDLTYTQMQCPDCDLEIKGLALPRHRGSRLCISVQLMRGAEGERLTPIMRLGCLASYIQSKGASIDDGDIDDFSQALEEAGNVPRFRYSSSRQFNRLVLHAIRIIRNKWTFSRRCTYAMDIVPFREEERSLIHFFRKLGKNLKRLPLMWIDMGEYEDMCSSVTTGIKEFLPPPPRVADPEIAATNVYPGHLFADEVLDDEDNANSEVEIEFSDDEALQFEYAPLATMTQLMMSSGNIPASGKVLQCLFSQKALLKESAQDMVTGQSTSTAFALNQSNQQVQEIKQRILSESSMVASPHEAKANEKTPQSSADSVSFF